MYKQSTMKKVTTILTVLCLIYLQDVNAKVKVFRKSHLHLHKKILFNMDHYIDERLTYAVCDENPNPKGMNCTVKREKKAYDNDEYSCDVILKLHSKNGRIGLKPTVIPFGQNNAVVIWQENAEKHYFRFTTLQMSNCKVGEAEIDLGAHHIPLFSLHFVGYNDSFDVFYKDDSCDGKMCKVTINADGHIVYGPRPFIAERFYNQAKRRITSIDKNSSSKGYFYLKRDETEYTYTLLTPNGTEKSLDKHDQTYTTFAVSIDNKHIRTCCQGDSDSKYHCYLYDLDGNFQLQTTIPSFSDRSRLLEIYNSPNGDFYVLSYELQVSHGKHLSDQVARFVVERIDATGKKIGSFNIEEFQWLYYVHGIAFTFYESETKETCVSLIAHRAADRQGPEERKGYLLFTANCFTDADFTNQI